MSSVEFVPSFSNFPVYVVAFTYLSLQYLAPKRGIKMRGRSCCQPFNPLEFTSLKGQVFAVVRGGAKTMASSSFSSHLWVLAAKHRSLICGGQDLFAHTGFHKLCAGCSMNMHTAACHERGGEWVAGAVRRGEIDQNLSSRPSLGNCKFFNRLQNFRRVTSPIFCQDKCCLGQKDEFLMFPTPPPSQNPPGFR